MFSGGIFWFGMGAVFVLVALGARAWAHDLRLRMSWWKWLLAFGWYGLLNFSAALGFTFIGEDEAGAGLRMLALLGVITTILGVGLARLLWSGRERSATDS